MPTGLVGVRTISGGSLGAFFFFFLLLLFSLISSSGSCSGRGGGGSEGKGGNFESGRGGAPSGFSRPIGGGGGGINSLSVLSANINLNPTYLLGKILTKKKNDFSIYAKIYIRFCPDGQTSPGCVMSPDAEDSKQHNIQELLSCPGTGIV